MTCVPPTINTIYTIHLVGLGVGVVTCGGRGLRVYGRDDCSYGSGGRDGG